MTTSNNIANRNTISTFFGIDELTTQRIMTNLSFGFFTSQFGTEADAKWNEAHPFMYPNNINRDFTSISLEFVAKHFELFSKKQFFTKSGWKFNQETNKMEFAYESGYIDIA